MCKKQTSVSHSSTESEVVSLDASSSLSQSMGFVLLKYPTLPHTAQLRETCATKSNQENAPTPARRNRYDLELIIQCGSGHHKLETCIEVVFQPWVTSPTEQPDDVSIPVGAEQVAFGAQLQVDDARRVEVPVRRFAIVFRHRSIGSPGDLEGDVDGSFASGEEEVFEVSAIEMVPPVRPSVASMRAGFVGLDDWNLEELFSPWVIDAFGSKILVGIIPCGNKVGVGRVSAWSGTRE